MKIVNAKAAKKYETEGRPVDLLLHFDHQPADPIAIARFVKEYHAELDNLRANGPFTRVWIYDDWSKRVLWMSDAAEAENV